MVLGGKNMELNAVTAAEESMFIKCSRSVAGDLQHSGELRCKFNKTRGEAFAPCGLKSLSRNLTNYKILPVLKSSGVIATEVTH